MHQYELPRASRSGVEQRYRCQKYEQQLPVAD